MFITDSEIPRASVPAFQAALDTYASETNKTAEVWHRFDDDQLAYRPHARSSSVEEIFRHQLLSERRFFGEFLGLTEPAADRVVPVTECPSARSSGVSTRPIAPVAPARKIRMRSPLHARLRPIPAVG